MVVGFVALYEHGTKSVRVVVCTPLALRKAGAQAVGLCALCVSAVLRFLLMNANPAPSALGFVGVISPRAWMLNGLHRQKLSLQLQRAHVCVNFEEQCQHLVGTLVVKVARYCSAMWVLAHLKEPAKSHLQVSLLSHGTEVAEGFQHTTSTMTVAALLGYELPKGLPLVHNPKNQSTALG